MKTVERWALEYSTNCESDFEKKETLTGSNTLQLPKKGGAAVTAEF
jgi:hypothetical protein